MAIKIELHAHTADDPTDRIPHTTRELIDHAASLHYGALAITLHDRQLDRTPYLEYARERGIVLLGGIERTVEGRHVLLINFPEEAERVKTFPDVASLKARSHGLVIAPHPFYPVPSAMGPVLDQYAGLVDAVEWNAMYTKRVDFNKAAARWATENSKPLVGNSDVHLLSQMGTTWSEVEAEPDSDAICEAIRAGRVHIRTTPLRFHSAAWVFANMVVFGWLGPKRGTKRGFHNETPFN
jgi:predicted metal-dependent phosphoesterase TrpH